MIRDCVTDGTRQTVTGQLPPAGAQVAEGFCAMLYVMGESAPKAQDYTQIPDVINMSMRNAAKAIREAGLVMQSQGEGIAIRQSPAAGGYLPAGQTVTVTFEMP